MRIILPAIAFSVAATFAADTLPPAASRTVDFTKDVEPLLKTRCYACHGSAQQISGLRLDDPGAALKGGYSGAAIKPSASADSPLIHRVAGQKGVAQMPPGPKKLTAEEVGVLRAWIDQGAKYPAGAKTAAVAAKPQKGAGHWAFQAVKRPKSPAIKDTGWAKNPIDTFVAARLEKEGYTPSGEADKVTLLRRVSLDLTGLLPTPTETEAFVNDKREDAYERLVDRLLNSPHYGEKWARHWLDLARFADSDGYEKDWLRPWAWRYRQWVINALNSNMPFDRFTIEQLAGDMLPNATVESKVATGFHRNSLTNREGGIDSEQFRVEGAMDRGATVGTVWLGLTLGCAQCHDHKYDPISQKDYYSMLAFFDNVEELDIDAPMPGETGPWLRTRDEYNAKRQDLIKQYNVPALMEAWEKEMLYTSTNPGKRTDWDLAWDCLLKLTEAGDGEKIIRIPREKRTAREQDILTDHFIRNYHFAVGSKKWKELKLDELDGKLRELYAKYPQLTQAYTLAEMKDHRRKSFIRVRGDYKNLGIEVTPAPPAFLPAFNAKGQTATRYDLANWVVSADNPLTSRVAVNRMWQEYFGQGIVRTSEDFGTQGEKPTHPELLDWLASEFMESGWDVKHMHKLIVTSATYRQASKTRPELETKDPNNYLLARQSRLRLPAELIRDSALQASGLINLAVGGKSVCPPQPKSVVELGYGNGKAWGVKWTDENGPDRYRRGLYVRFLRTTPYPLMQNFDAPKSTVAQCRRGRSNTALQALNLLNDEAFMEAAQAMAVRLVSEQKEFNDRLKLAFEMALVRQPTAREVQSMKKFYDRQKAILDTEKDSAAKLAPMVPDGADRLDVAAWTSLSTVLLNTDEFITRE